MADSRLPDESQGTRHRASEQSVGRIGTAVAAAGLLIALVVVVASLRLQADTERNLLAVQTHEASEALSLAILDIENPLDTALAVVNVSDGSRSQLAQSLSGDIGPGNALTNVSLWSVKSGVPTRVATLGVASRLSDPAAQHLMARAFRTGTYSIATIGTSRLDAVAYALADPHSGWAVYAERVLPADRVVPTERGAAFSDLDFATYIGAVRPADLATVNVPLSDLPFTGPTAEATVPFGNTSLTVVAKAADGLDGTLPSDLPWVFLVGGLILTAASTWLAIRLARRRRAAERDSETIANLYGQLDGLYGEQRSIAESLQRALLPQRNPDIPRLLIATQYVAGTDGLDIGGDWYSMIALDDRRFAFVVGDVSGRGVGAATVMARLRYTLRAYLVEGHRPEVALEMCSNQIDITEDGHFATVLVGQGDLLTGEVSFASAGHLPPMVIDDDGARLIDVPVGLPLGVERSSYAPHLIHLRPGALILAYTDGLVERRGESILTGLNRLLHVSSGRSEDPDDLLSQIVKGMAGAGDSDDVAMLAFRWLGDLAPEAMDSAAPIPADLARTTDLV